MSNAETPDVLPEPQQVAVAFRVALIMSLAAYVLFTGVVLRRRLLRTRLMRQIFCLCTCDFLVCLWELISCGSIVHFEHRCWQNCSLFLPLLRTLQMASALYTGHIAVSTALIVHGKGLPSWWSTLLVLPLAPLMSLSLWLETFAGEWHVISPKESQFCGPREGTNPDVAWQACILVVLGLTTLAYVYSAVRLGRLSSTTVAARKLKKVLAYVMVFLLCYLPYSIGQNNDGTETVEEKYSKGKVATWYLCFYFLYMLTGACNVAVYAYHHWDATLWQRHRAIQGDGAAGLRVVMFGSRTSRTISGPGSEVTPVAESVASSTSTDGYVIDEVRADECDAGSIGVTMTSAVRSDRRDPDDVVEKQFIVAAVSEYGTDAYWS